MLFSSRVRVRVRFSDRLVSGYAYAFILLSVVIVTLPANLLATTECMRNNSIFQHTHIIRDFM